MTLKYVRRNFVTDLNYESILPLIMMSLGFTAKQYGPFITESVK